MYLSCCKSLAFASFYTSFRRVLPTSFLYNTDNPSPPPPLPIYKDRPLFSNSVQFCSLQRSNSTFGSTPCLIVSHFLSQQALYRHVPLEAIHTTPLPHLDHIGHGARSVFQLEINLWFHRLFRKILKVVAIKTLRKYRNNSSHSSNFNHLWNAMKSVRSLSLLDQGAV